MEIQGKVALVTGGARRLGRAMALELGRRGARVAVHYGRSKDEAEAVAREIEAMGSRAEAFGADLKNLSRIDDLCDRVEDTLGPVDILINSASVFHRTAFGGVSHEDWDDTLGSNLRGPFFLSQRIGPGMKRRGAGKVINFGDANMPYAVPDFMPYAIAKAGVEALTRGLARALAPEVQVNAILPGAILPASGGDEAGWEAAVKANLLRRGGGPEAIVRAMLYLIEDDFLTGVLLPVDGGRSLGR